MPTWAANSYNTEPVFRQAIDHCAEILAEEEGIDLLHTLYNSERGEFLFREASPEEKFSVLSSQF